MRDKTKRFNIAFMIVAAMILGIVAGLIGGKYMTSVRFVGDIFFRLIQMSIIPFVMCVLIEAIGNLKPRDLTNIGLRGVFYFVLSTTIAASIGLACALILKPGVGVTGLSAPAAAASSASATANPMSLQESIVGFFGGNIIASMQHGSMVQCIVFAIAFGLIISFCKTSENSIVYKLCCELLQHLLTIIRGVMYIAPLGIFCYVSAMVGSLGLHILLPLLRYLVVLTLAVLISTCLWVALVCIRIGISPLRLFRKMWGMSVLAMASTSSAVTLPLALKDSKAKLGIHPEVADLILPLGMPLNSNGAAIHLAVSAITIAQMFNTSYDAAGLIGIIVVSVLLSLANAVVPGGSVVALTMLVPQLGLPIQSIAIFAGLEYPVGALRTVLNVNSDVYSAMLVTKDIGKFNYEQFNAENPIEDEGPAQDDKPSMDGNPFVDDNPAEGMKSAADGEPGDTE